MLRLKSPPNFEINYLQADVNYTIFHLHDGKKIVSSFTLKKFEHDSRLSSFLRVNKSILLNPNFVQKIEKEGLKTTIIIQDGTAMKVSRRKRYLSGGDWGWLMVSLELLGFP